jgi:lambda repressor-like predicted transcriptional regulator
MPTPTTALKRVLLAEGRKQSWLAGQAGIREDQLSRIVNGLHCDPSTREAIAKALGRSVDELWPASIPADREAA